MADFRFDAAVQPERLADRLTSRDTKDAREIAVQVDNQLTPRLIRRQYNPFDQGADLLCRFAPTIRGAWRARGVRLVASDVDWSHGTGPEVRGTGEALLMAMAGRLAALDDLDGAGKAKLARHI